MDDPADDVEGGLRFLHVMGMQIKLDLADAAARILALTEELIARGVVSLRALDQRMGHVRVAEGERPESGSPSSTSTTWQPRGSRPSPRSRPSSRRS